MPGSAGALRRGVGGLPAESATGPGSGNRPGTLAPSPANRLGFDGEGVPHAQEGRGLCDWGDHRRHQSWCARPSTWRPAAARTRQGETIHPAPGPWHPGTPPPSSVPAPGTRRDTECVSRREEPGCAGRVPRPSRGHPPSTNEGAHTATPQEAGLSPTLPPG